MDTNVIGTSSDDAVCTKLGKKSEFDSKIASFRCTRNTTISTSTSNFGSSGRVDGPLLETHSWLICQNLYVDNKVLC